MEWILKKFNELTADELYGIIQLRVEIFVVEQDCPYQDLDGKDRFCYHLFLKDNNEITATLRIIPPGISYDDSSIGRVVVKKSHRRKGLGDIMMKKAIDIMTSEMGYDSIRLSGQAYLTEFYLKLGFEKVSDMYLEDGIEHFEFRYSI